MVQQRVNQRSHTDPAPAFINLICMLQLVRCVSAVTAAGCRTPSRSLLLRRNTLESECRMKLSHLQFTAVPRVAQFCVFFSPANGSDYNSLRPQNVPLHTELKPFEIKNRIESSVSSFLAIPGPHRSLSGIVKVCGITKFMGIHRKTMTSM